MTIETEPVIADLADRISGDVVGPRDPAWDRARQPFNLLLDQRPAAVVLAESVRDVVETIDFARRSGLRVAPQATGHNAGPLAGSVANTLLLRTSRMRGVEVDVDARLARARAGAVWDDLAGPLAGTGLAALHGSSPDVGIVGYSLGGGMGWMARRHGLQASSVTTVQVVTADGRVRAVDREHESHLFWALRGGGGGFGVVTAIEFALHRVDELCAGALFFPAERAAEVLHTWNALTPALPDEMTSVGRVLGFPPDPAVPDALRGGTFAIVEAAHLGTEAEAAELLEPLRSLGPVLDTFAAVAPRALGELHMDPRHPVPALTADRLLGELPPQAIDDLLAAAGPGSGSSLVGFELRHLGGALARTSPEHGARGTVPGAFSLFAVGVVDDGRPLAAVDADLERLLTAARPWVTGRDPNFAERPADLRSFHRGDTLARLRAVKTLYDPDDLIVANHPIPPLEADGD